jgi:hypothetical protein
MMHVKCHLAQPGENPVRKDSGSDKVKFVAFVTTQEDEKKQPAGLPFTSVLILRNFARFASKADPEQQYVDRLFGHVKPKILNTFAHNLTLRHYLADLLRMIDSDGQQKT